MKRIRAHLTYSNVVSTLCLFILLGGGAYAAVKLPKNSVGTKQLKNNAVKGSKVANGSLTAADISGSVQSASNADHASTADNAANASHAATADTAANAAELGGAAPSSFFPSSKVRRVDLEVEETTAGSHDHPLLTLGPLTLIMACNKGASLTIGLTAISSAPGASVYLGFENDEAQSNGVFFPVQALGGEAGVLTVVDNATGKAGSGQLVYRDDNTSISMTFGYLVSNLLSECRLSGVAVQS